LLGKLIKQPGEGVIDCAIQTRRGTKVADVAWFSLDRWRQVADDYEVPIAPQLCVEVVSLENFDDELERKRILYLDVGAEEVWNYHDSGGLRFYNRSGELKQSRLVPGFPKDIG
jgi:Uma2 family endonuclease